MVKVWTALVVAMTLAGLACLAALPRKRPSSSNLTDLKDPAAVDALVRPADLGVMRRWRYIVIHHSATPAGTVEAITQHHRNRGFQDVGYHFVINNGRSAGTTDGEITPTERWRQQLPGAHAGAPDHPEFNEEGIGICLIGDFEKRPPTPAQMAALEVLVLALRDRCQIPLEHIIGHGEIKNTQCPGRLFPMEEFLMDLRLAYLRGVLQRTGEGN